MKILIGIAIALYLLHRLVRAARAEEAQQDHRSWNDKYGGAW